MDIMEWNRGSKILHEKIKEIKNETFKSYMSGFIATDNTGYSLWKAIRHMKRPRVQIPPIRKVRKEDGTWECREQEKAEIYARHFAKPTT